MSSPQDPALPAALPPSLPAVLPGLTTREAIIDAVYRCLNGIDIPDEALFLSAFTQDVNFDLSGRVTKGKAALLSEVYQPISKLHTAHVMSNFRVAYEEGSSTASVTATAIGPHFRPGEGLKGDAKGLLAGGLYYIQCVKDGEDGQWKIKDYKVRMTWADGDWGVFGSQ